MSRKLSIQDSIPFAQSLIEETYPAKSLERAYMHAVMQDDMSENQRLMSLYLLIGDKLEDSLLKLQNTRGNVSDNAAISAMRVALKNISNFSDKFSPLFAQRGYIQIQPEGTWHFSRKEYAPGRVNNPNDKHNLASVDSKIPAEYAPIMKAAYIAFIRANLRKENKQFASLNYSELCAVGGLLLPENDRADFLGKIAKERVTDKGYNYAEFDRSIDVADNFIVSYAANHNLPMPEYDVQKYLLGPKTRQEIADNRARQVATKKPEKKSPGLAAVSFLTAGGIAVTDENNDYDRIAHRKPVELPSKKISLKGRDGFDLQSAQSKLTALVRGRDISENMRQIFNTFAAESPPSIANYAKEHDTTPMKVRLAYGNVSVALKNMDCKNVPKL